MKNNNHNKNTHYNHSKNTLQSSSSFKYRLLSLLFNKMIHVLFLIVITFLLSIQLISNVQQLLHLSTTTTTTPSTTTTNTNSISDSSVLVSSVTKYNTNLTKRQLQLQLQEQYSTYTKNSNDIVLLQCTKEYYNIKNNYQQTNGLQSTDYKRSNVYYGNRRRLSLFLQKLQLQTTPVNVIACGGSITIGHGVEPKEARYANRFINFLNTKYPIRNNNSEKPHQQQKIQHELHMKVAHGADICAMAKRINRIELPDNPDLFILEFAVNDYQGQDDIEYVDHKTDMFFNGFEQKVICAEAVVHYILNKYPNTAIVFFEFRSIVINRKSAQLLHTGVAQHYQIPIISYGDTIFPHYLNLVHQLNSSSLYSVPVGDSIQPYPFGCLPECNTSQINVAPVECYTVCDHMNNKPSIVKSECTIQHIQSKIPTNEQQRIPCYLSFSIHDSVHPSYTGHQIATDLLIEMIAVTTRDLCYMKQSNSTTSSTTATDVAMTGESTTTTMINNRLQLHVPKPFGFIASVELLKKTTDFIIIKDTMYTYGMQDILVPNRKSDGFTYYADGAGGRKGLICTNNVGNEYMEFDINLPIIEQQQNDDNNNNDCYVIYIAALKSYINMGIFTVTITDTITNKTTTKVIDSIWEPRISIPSDTQINSDNINDDGSCTGQCTVRITTHDQLSSRIGSINKVKIMSLSVRKCIIPESIETTTESTTKKTKEQQLDEPTSWLVV